MRLTFCPRRFRARLTQELSTTRPASRPSSSARPSATLCSITSRPNCGFGLPPSYVTSSPPRRTSARSCSYSKLWHPSTALQVLLVSDTGSITTSSSSSYRSSLGTNQLRDDVHACSVGASHSMACRHRHTTCRSQWHLWAWTWIRLVSVRTPTLHACPALAELSWTTPLCGCGSRSPLLLSPPNHFDAPYVLLATSFGLWSAVWSSPSSSSKLCSLHHWL